MGKLQKIFNNQIIESFAFNLLLGIAPSCRILDWEFFRVGEDSYLIGTNQQPGYNMEFGVSNTNRDTIIYRWQGAEKFVPTHKIQTSPSADWEVLTDGRNTYLIYANGSGRSTEIFKAKLR